MVRIFPAPAEDEQELEQGLPEDGSQQLGGSSSSSSSSSEAVPREAARAQHMGGAASQDGELEPEVSDHGSRGGVEDETSAGTSEVNVDTAGEPNAEIDVVALREEAQRHRRKTACTVLNKETGQYEFLSVWAMTPRQMGHLGVGVELYFQFIKQMGFVFLFMALLSLPALLSNFAGSMVEESSMLNRAFGMLSVANLGTCPSSGCQSFAQVQERCAFVLRLPLFYEREEDTCDLRVKDIAEWIGFLDGLAILTFMGFGMFFAHSWIPRIVRETDDANTTPADYTVWIPSLPKYLPDADDHANYPEKLAEHFRQVLRSAARDPIEDPFAVQVVTVVHGYDGAIMQFGEKGNHMQDQENARLLRLRAQAQGKEKSAAKHEKHISGLDDKIRKIEKRLRTQARMTDDTRSVCSAFVTFTHEEYKDRVLDEYRFANHALFKLCQPEGLRFGGQRLNVVKACDPTDLYWENLDYDYRKRMMRKGVIVFFTFLVLVVCSVVIASLESISGDQAPEVLKTTWIVANTPASGSACLSFCSWDLFSSPSCTLDGQSSKTWPTARLFDASGTIADIVELNGECSNPWRLCDNLAGNSSSRAWLGIEFDSAQAVKCMKVRQHSVTSAHELRILSCASGAAPENASVLASWDPAAHCQAMELVYPASAHSSGSLSVVPDTSCATDPASYIEFEVATLAKADSVGSPVGNPSLNCFCRQQASNNLAGFMTPPWSTPAEELCKEWSQEMTMTYLKVGGSVLAITVLNEVLLVIYSYFIAWERLCTVTELAKSQLGKLFLSQFVNTGLLMLLVNANIKQYPSVLAFIKVLSIGEGSYHDMTGQWYTVVGTTLILTVLAKVASSSASPIVMSQVVHPLMERFYSKKKLTQETLNAVYTLPEWNLSLRLAEGMNIIFCVVMYSGGMPILYLVGALYCLTSYWIDKRSLLRGSHRPPAYKEDVVMMSVNMLPVAAFLHTAVAAWTFGNQALLPSDWSTLQPLAESLFGITEARYLEVMESYRMGVMEGLTMDFMRARFLDFSRKGTWLLMLIFLACSVFYIASYLWALVLRPFLSPFAFLSKELILSCARGCAKRCGWSLPPRDTKISVSWEEAKLEMEAKGMTTSYRLADNEKYHAAYKALQHTHSLVKAQTLAKASEAAWAAARWSSEDCASIEIGSTKVEQ